MKPFAFSFLMLTVGCLTLFSQIPNADFEDWVIAPNGGEVPAMWNSPFQNQHDAIFKSSDSFSGDYSLGIATLNISDNGSFAPAYFGTKIKPTILENTLTFYYKIDSLVDDGKARVYILRIDEFGAWDYSTVHQKKLKCNDVDTGGVVFLLPILKVRPSVHKIPQKRKFAPIPVQNPS